MKYDLMAGEMDIFTLGVVLYKLIVLENPFEKAVLKNDKYYMLHDSPDTYLAQI